jgi:dihydrofolate synthase/folylpolyglutamate synthase
MTSPSIQRINEYNRFGSKLGLERMEKLLELLDHPERDLCVIHVAGTNGKGSVCRYIYEVLLANGYGVGLYISPFLEVFNERMEVDGERITDLQLEKHTSRVLRAAESLQAQGEESPTEFEIVTAIAFSFFQEQKCDFVVLEVGLGGSGDSTNVIKNPLLTIITSISYDHMDRLGGTLEEIAGEKAGIIKERVPCVIYVEDLAAARVIAKRAYEKNAPLYDATGLEHHHWVPTLEGQVFDTKIHGTYYSNVRIRMLGMHQVHNAITALTALEVLRQSKKIQVTKDLLYQGMERASQPGRFEIMKREPYVILDGAHNQAGAESLAETMGEFFQGASVLMVVGILADKEVDAMIGPFCEVGCEFIVTEPISPRALPAEELGEKLKKKGKPVEVYTDMKEATRRGMQRLEEENWDVLVFGGSLYLVGKVREMMGNGR